MPCRRMADLAHSMPPDPVPYSLFARLKCFPCTRMFYCIHTWTAVQCHTSVCATAIPEAKAQASGTSNPGVGSSTRHMCALANLSFQHQSRACESGGCAGYQRSLRWYPATMRSTLRPMGLGGCWASYTADHLCGCWFSYRCVSLKGVTQTVDDEKVQRPNYSVSQVVSLATSICIARNAPVRQQLHMSAVKLCIELAPLDVNDQRRHKEVGCIDTMMQCRRAMLFHSSWVSSNAYMLTCCCMSSITTKVIFNICIHTYTQ